MTVVEERTYDGPRDIDGVIELVKTEPAPKNLSDRAIALIFGDEYAESLYYHCDPVTWSVESIGELIRIALPGWYGSVQIGDRKIFRAELIGGPPEAVRNYQVHGEGETPAIAMCMAALEAKKLLDQLAIVQK